MPTPGFHSEWITIADTRGLLCCRSSFPDDRMKLMSQVAVETCKQNSTTHRAAVVEVYLDDQATVWTVTVASTDQADKKLGPILQGVLQAMLDTGNVLAETVIVPEGDSQSSNYDHMEHLSVGACVGADRWKRKDEQRQKAG